MADPLPELREGWPEDLRGARLAYEKGRDILLVEHGKAPRRWIENGRWPRWSRFGEALFFIRGKEICWKSSRTEKETFLVRLSNPTALAVFDRGRFCCTASPMDRFGGCPADPKPIGRISGCPKT